MKQKSCLNNSIKNGYSPKFCQKQSKGKIGTVPIFFLVGPTAVGKTEISLELAKAINAEIISCDSMQVYRKIDIISQKPTKLQLKKVPHHMIGVVSPSENFSVADYRKKALKEIKAIYKKGKIPLLVGGTGLYMKVLIDGLFPSPKPDLKLRERLKKEAEVKAEVEGKDYLYKKLQKIDPETAAMLHPNDARRIIRALEIYKKTGSTMSQLKKKTKGLGSDYCVRIFSLNRQREELYDRINKRVEKMFKSGAVEECRRLKGIKLSLSASQILGCKEIFAYLDNKCTKQEVMEALKQNTRRFAKRQLSWFRNEPRAEVFDIKVSESARQTAKALKRKIING